MKRKSTDLAIGIVVVLGTILLCCGGGVARGILVACCCLCHGTAVLYLWNLGPRGGKVLAVLLLPGILLRYLLPKKFRMQIAALPRKDVRQ